MADLIDRQEFMKAMYHKAFETDGDTMWQSGCWVRYRAVEQVVKGQPTVDAVEAVRCKDCKYQDKGENESESWNVCNYRPWLYFSINDDDYCSNGEQK